MRSAYFAREWKKVLEVCAKVRAAGSLQWEHLEAEVEVLANSREADRAISLLSDWMHQHPSDKHARLHLSFLALQHRQPDFATLDEAQLPSMADVSHPGEGAALVYVLRRGPAPERALDIAYKLYRRFPEDIAAHHTLVSCVFDPSAEQLQIDRPTVIGPGTAARIQREGELPRWIYVEDGPDPAVTRGEYPRSHELIVALWGNRSAIALSFMDTDTTFLVSST